MMLEQGLPWDNRKRSVPCILVTTKPGAVLTKKNPHERTEGPKATL